MSQYHKAKNKPENPLKYGHSGYPMIKKLMNRI